MNKQRPSERDTWVRSVFKEASSSNIPFDTSETISKVNVEHKRFAVCCLNGPLSAEEG